jgi:hypothetical protein
VLALKFLGLQEEIKAETITFKVVVIIDMQRRFYPGHWEE